MNTMERVRETFETTRLSAFEAGKKARESLVHMPERHGAEATCVAYSPDGRLLVSAGRDGQAIVWDTVSGRQLLAPR